MSGAQSREKLEVAVKCRRIERSKAVSQYVQFGAFLITVPNLIVIVTMIVVFAVGLLVKLPDRSRE